VLLKALRFVAEPGQLTMPSLVTPPSPYRTFHPPRLGRVIGRLCSFRPDNLVPQKGRSTKDLPVESTSDGHWVAWLSDKRHMAECIQIV